MDKETKDGILNRFARIEGQVRGIGKMVDDDRYCIDILRQVQAVKSALQGAEAIILDDHLKTCVADALMSDDVDDRRAKVAELVAVMGGRKK